MQTQGINPTETHVTPLFRVGERGFRLGKQYVYVKAGTAIATAIPCSYSSVFVASVSGNGGVAEGVTPVAVAINEYFWLQVQGAVTANVADGLVAGNLVSFICDANGDLALTVAVAEGGATAHTSGQHSVRGILLDNVAAGLATVRLN